jgi:hypothetical protein
VDDISRVEQLKQAAMLMEQALDLLDAAGEARAAAMLDHAIELLPNSGGMVRENRAVWPLDDSDLT